MLAQVDKGVLGAQSLDDVEIRFLQHGGREIAHEGIVLDDHDG